MVEATVREFRLAARRLHRNPGFTAAAVLTLAIGIGATTAVFSVVYAVVLRPLPFPHADRLVQIIQVLEPTPNSPEPIRAGLTPNQFVDIQENSRTIAAVGGYAPAPRTFAGLPVPLRLTGAAVTPSLFAGIGVAPAIGRIFGDGDSATGADPVVILSYQTWVRYFGADPAVLSRQIAFENTRPRVIGVMPDGFGFPSLASASLSMNSIGELDDAPEFWIPASGYERTAESGGYSLFQAFALLRENTSPEQARAELQALLTPLPQGRRATLEIVSAHREMGRDIASVLGVFQLGVTFILLIACVNVVNLLLSRAAHKHREVAIRTALGASRRRIAREGVTESILLALGGGMVGCLLAYALTWAIRVLPPHLVPRLREVALDRDVLLFAVALSLGTGIFVGLFSAIRAVRKDSAADIVTARSRASAHSGLRPSAWLVVTEVALGVVLLVGAGLLINSFARLMQVDPGLHPDSAVTFRLTLPATRYPSPDAQQQLVRDVVATVRRIPGVEAAAATSFALDGGPIALSPLRVDAQEIRGGFRFRFITADYFRTMGTAIRGGRDFTDQDRGAAAAHAIVNEAFAQRYFGDSSIVGRHVGYSERPSLEIIGVVADSRIRLHEEPQPVLYLPADAQASFVSPSFVVRTSGDPRAVIPAIRDAVRQRDPQLALYNATTLRDMLDHTAASPRLYSLVSFSSAAVGLLLAAIGLYGVLAYSVATRTREFGIRIALGARSGDVIMAVMRRGLALALLGVAIGLAGAYYTTRFLDSLLFGLTPHDPVTFAVTTAIFLAVAAAACYIPSRRATRVDPVFALRAE